MLFPVPLVRGSLIRRYKRFFGEVLLDGGELVTAHCANTGAMIGLNAPGTEVWLSPAGGPGRKLLWNWEMVRVDGGLVGVHTGHPNRLVAEAVREGRILELAGYATMRAEVRYGRNSRVDLLLETDGRPKCYVEVKNVHLKRGRAAEFPDAVTARGAKHLAELAAMAAAGCRAVMFFLVQRADCDHFRIAGDIDPGYAAALAKAMADGVEVICYSCALDLEGITVHRPLAMAL